MTRMWRSMIGSKILATILGGNSSAFSQLFSPYWEYFLNTVRVFTQSDEYFFSMR